MAKEHHVYDIELSPGVRMEAVNIEKQIRLLPGIKEACVELVTQGAGRWLVAIVTTDASVRGGRTAGLSHVLQNETDWGAMLSKTLPVMAVPDTFIHVDSMPMFNGSVDRKVLRRKAEHHCRGERSLYQRHDTATLHGILESACRRWPHKEVRTHLRSPLAFPCIISTSDPPFNRPSVARTAVGRSLSPSS